MVIRVAFDQLGWVEMDGCGLFAGFTDTAFVAGVLGRDPTSRIELLASPWLDDDEVRVMQDAVDDALEIDGLERYVGRVTVVRRERR